MASAVVRLLKCGVCGDYIVRCHHKREHGLRPAF